MLHNYCFGVLIQMCKNQKTITIALKLYFQVWCIRYLKFVIWIKYFDLNCYVIMKFKVYILNIYVWYFKEWFNSNYFCQIDKTIRVLWLFNVWLLPTQNIKL